jgi:hypothetical protein
MSLLDTVRTLDWRQVALYILITLFVIVAILMLAGINPFPAAVTGDRVAQLQQTYWTSSTKSKGLTLDKSDLMSQKIGFNRYTIAVDMMWGNIRTTAENKTYRHILHRGSDEIKNLTEESGLTTASAEAITTFRDVQYGLPDRMNPGFFVDPVSNDMLIFIDTDYNNQIYRESIRVPDIPMDNPFTLTIVVMDNLVEVYLNCMLEITKLLKGLPRNMDSTWFGLSGPMPLNGGIKNLRMWNTALTVKEIKQLCAEPPTFTLDKSSTCTAY